jgi:pimeloyl-ACP methyl ester carboxylesterase
MIERTIHFGPSGTLIGTVTLPGDTAPASGKRGVLLTNAGIIPRIGPHRLNVLLARRAAEAGLHAFRFDMAGLGDSERREDGGTLLQQRVADIRIAMDQMQRSHGLQRFAMVGFCSGADLAHLTALEDARLDTIVMFDPYIYRTPRALLNHFLRQAQVRGWPHALGIAFRSLFNARDGRADAASLNSGIIQGRSIFPSRDEFAQRLRTLRSRGVRILMVFSGGNQTLYNYAGQFEDGFRRYGLADQIENAYLPQCDHMITTATAQSSFMDLVLPWLRAPAPTAASTSAEAAA